MLLTIREAQRLTGLSSDTIRDHITSGRIPYEKKGNKYLIDESELAKLPKPRNTAAQKIQNVEGPTEKAVPQGDFFTVYMEALRKVPPGASITYQAPILANAK